MKKIRLDQLVFDLGYTESRERAKTTIMSGLVFVGDTVAAEAEFTAQIIKNK